MINMINKVNFSEKFGKFNEQWSPKIVAELNDYHLKVVKLEGDFVWHKHDDTDEVFVIMDGTMHLDCRDEANGEYRVTLEKGEMVSVPRGLEHKPYAETECQVLLIEPAGTENTGNAQGTDTISTTKGEWI